MECLFVQAHPRQRSVEVSFGALVRVEQHHLQPAVYAAYAITCGLERIEGGIRKQGIDEALNAIGHPRTRQAAKRFNRNNEMRVPFLGSVDEFADLHERLAAAHL